MRSDIIDEAPFTASAAELMHPVIAGWSCARMSDRPPTAAALRLPMAPSNVEVDLAAFTAASSNPSCMMAALNSSAEISPFSIASRKLPV